MTHNRLAKMLFNDDSDDEFHLLATMIEEEEMENEDRTPHRPGSIPGHAVIRTVIDHGDAGGASDQ